MKTFKLKADVKRRGKIKHDVREIKNPVTFLVDAETLTEAKKNLRKDLRTGYLALIRIKR